jgi:hypothetical protein
VARARGTEPAGALLCSTVSWKDTSVDFIHVALFGSLALAAVLGYLLFRKRARLDVTHLDPVTRQDQSSAVLAPVAARTALEPPPPVSPSPADPSPAHVAASVPQLTAPESKPQAPPSTDIEGFSLPKLPSEQSALKEVVKQTLTPSAEQPPLAPRAPEPRSASNCAPPTTSACATGYQDGGCPESSRGGAELRKIDRGGPAGRVPPWPTHRGTHKWSYMNQVGVLMGVGNRESVCTGYPPTIGRVVVRFLRYVRRLTPRATLRKAGVLSPRFWLRGALSSMANEFKDQHPHGVRAAVSGTQAVSSP